jgi:hypothetical protein
MLIPGIFFLELKRRMPCLLGILPALADEYGGCIHDVYPIALIERFGFGNGSTKENSEVTGGRQQAQPTLPAN